MVRVLVVEDETIISLDIQAMLSQLGHEVVGAVTTGKEAIAMCDRFEPTVVLMDINLKGTINGVEAAKAIRAKHDSKVVFLSAYSTFEKMHSKELSASVCISKPFDMPDISWAINEVLKKDSGIKKGKKKK